MIDSESAFYAIHDLTICRMVINELSSLFNVSKKMNLVEYDDHLRSTAVFSS